MLCVLDSFQTTDPELWTFVNLNLAMVYLRMNRQDEFMAVLNNVEPERLRITLVSSLVAKITRLMFQYSGIRLLLLS